MSTENFNTLFARHKSEISKHRAISHIFTEHFHDVPQSAREIPELQRPVSLPKVTISQKTRRFTNCVVKDFCYLYILLGQSYLS
jgi:hypothetical protein